MLRSEKHWNQDREYIREKDHGTEDDIVGGTLVRVSRGKK